MPGLPGGRFVATADRLLRQSVGRARRNPRSKDYYVVTVHGLRNPFSVGAGESSCFNPPRCLLYNDCAILWRPPRAPWDAHNSLRARETIRVFCPVGGGTGRTVISLSLRVLHSITAVIARRAATLNTARARTYNITFVPVDLIRVCKLFRPALFKLSPKFSLVRIIKLLGHITYGKLRSVRFFKALTYALPTWCGT